MQLRELLSEILGAEVAGSTEIDIAAVDHDSRTVGARSLFVCIRGFKQDGHAFIARRPAPAAGSGRRRDDPARLASLPGDRHPSCQQPVGTGKVGGSLLAHPSRRLRLGRPSPAPRQDHDGLSREAIPSRGSHRVGLSTRSSTAAELRLPGGAHHPEASDLQRLLARMRDMGAWAPPWRCPRIPHAPPRWQACEFDVASSQPTQVFTRLPRNHGSATPRPRPALFATLGQARVKPGVAGAS